MSQYKYKTENSGCSRTDIQKSSVHNGPHASQGIMNLHNSIGNQAVCQLMKNNNPPSSHNNTGLPDALKAKFEKISGFSLDNIKVHYNSDKPQKAGAYAYAQGTDIHISPGQEKHLPHEAWHVVQQAQGRVKPTLQMKGIQVNDESALEKEADRMGASVSENSSSALNSIQASNMIANNSTSAPIQMSPFKGLRRWLGRIGGPAFGKSGRLGRAERHHPDGLPEPEVIPAEPAIDPVEDYRQAYEKSRFYHGTLDREGVLGGDNPIGLQPSQDNTSRDGSKGTRGRVFLSKPYDTAIPYATSSMLGVFLPNNRTQPRTPEHEEYFAGTRPGNERDELFRDIGMGSGAHYTEKPVPAANITDTLLENLTEDRQTPIFDAIRTHMQHPMSDAELRQLHTVLRNQRRLSVQREGTPNRPIGYGQ